MRKVQLILLILLLSQFSYSQGEWNNWYFGRRAGLTFNNGSPVVLTNGVQVYGSTCASISDSLGNLLFYTDGQKVYTWNHLLMTNGTGLLGLESTQGSIILPFPGHRNLYYIINVAFLVDDPSIITGSGLYYSIVDMSKDDGKGEVTVKNVNIYLPVTGKAMDKLTSVRHKNNRDIWIVTRAFPGNQFVSLLLTPTGIQFNGVISNSFKWLDTSTIPWQNQLHGELKISPDGKKMACAYNHLGLFEFGNFDIETGKYTFSFGVDPPDITVNNYVPRALEFSPDSKLLFCSSPWEGTGTYEEPFYQYDATKNDSVEFAQSIMTAGFGLLWGMQTGPDGKIYGGHIDDPYISIINSPNERGLFCNFEHRKIFLEDGLYFYSLPQMIQKYFAYFSAKYLCARQPVEFSSNIWPAPDSVLWNFGDVGSGVADTSSIINPSHIYNTDGSYQVTLIAYWPGDRSDTTLETIVVKPAADPGLDTIMHLCKGDTIAMTSLPFPSYLWSTGDTTQLISVSDTGYYSVEVINVEGCSGWDTTRVNYFAPPELDETSLVRSPTACGGSTGAIRGLSATGVEPISIKWKDVYGNILGSDYDLYDLPVGNYYLWALDGNGCTNMLNQYNIQDAGNVLIDSVDYTDSYCGLNNGSITIAAVSGLSDMLDYSLNDGDEYFTNEGVFTSLVPGQYVIRVRVTDSTGCQAVYEFNPVIIEDKPGPEVISESTEETGSNADGTITLNATGFGLLMYSLNGGIAQTDNTFTGLTAGSYHFMVTDENGCITEGDIEVGHVPGFILSAIAGNDTVCMSQTLKVPVLVSNFNEVLSFSVTLNYDSQKVNCEGYLPGSINPQLSGLVIEVYPALQRIVAGWSSPSPVSLSGTKQLFELVFTANETGSSVVTWDESQGMTWFTGEGGNIEVDFVIGELQVNNPAKVLMYAQPTSCEGGILAIAPLYEGTPPLEYHWQMPGGETSTQDVLFMFDASLSQSGEYRIKVQDALGCADSTTIQAIVVPRPSAGFSNDTIPFEQAYRLEATAGYANYEWNTGDTTYYCNVTEEGEYCVVIKTVEGCQSADTVRMVNVEVPIQIPNSFTPNADGLNDTFKPIIIRPDLISNYHLTIYNHWGQRIFEASNPAQGWDGKHTPSDVYYWVISYSNLIGKAFQLKGVVSLIK